MRRLITFRCEGDTLVGSFDAAAGATGLLIVSGGNEIRAGAHRGMAMLAAHVAAAGFPVCRFDRRGVGDSEGENRGFRSSGPDIAAAAAAFRAETEVKRLIAFGNCDGASALALFGQEAGVDAVILANPWLADPVDDLPPVAAIRTRYAERLRDPAALLGLVTGEVSLRKLTRGLRRLTAPRSPVPALATTIAGWRNDATILLASGDATALAYAEAAATLPIAQTTIRFSTASHSFGDAGDELAAAVVRILAAA